MSLATSLIHEALPILDLVELLFGRKVTLRLKEDNTATIKILRKGYSAKLRHVSRTHKIDLDLIKDICDAGNAELEHVETDKQAADIFTKDLPPLKWPRAIELLGFDTSSAPPLDVEPDVHKKGGADAVPDPHDETDNNVLLFKYPFPKTLGAIVTFMILGILNFSSIISKGIGSVFL